MRQPISVTAAQPRWIGGRWMLIGALAAFVLAIAPPLGALAGYLLSAHMLQHLLLSQVAPPLLLLALPAAAAERALRRPGLARAERALRRPAVAWLAGVGALWFWHIPAIYVASRGAPLVQDASVLLAGLLFWWPVFAPAPASRMHALPTTLYLAAACAASTMLGIALTFAPGLIYPDLLSGPAAPAGVRFVCSLTGLTPLVDQQVGGLLMWVPCCMLYLITVAAVLGRWYGEPEQSGVGG